MLPARVAQALELAGCNVFGCLSREAYDARVPEPWWASVLLPGARSALLIASGGRSLFEAFSRAPESGLAGDPLDAYTRRVIETQLAGLPAPSRALFPFEKRGGLYADFVALARAAGLGAPSRLGLLLHPVYGPWWALRAVVLSEQELEPSTLLADFDPCPGCPAPCAAACPGGAIAESFQRATCLATRARESGCRLACAARRACVVGPEHAYTPEAEAHHMRYAPIPPGPC